MKILVTGGTGMVGKALQEIMPGAIYVGSRNYDLTSQHQVQLMFSEVRPDVVIHLAATVSGIEDNINRPVEHFDDNVLMNTLVIKTAHSYGVKRLIGVLSTCIYPDTSERYPLEESDIHRGAPAETNFSYAMAKRAMAAQIDAYNVQYGLNYAYLIPANIFGKYDKFIGPRSHYIGALLHKIYEAIICNKNEICLFGTGTPLRQFVYSSDVAQIIKRCIDWDVYMNMNIASDEVYTIDQIAKIALEACNCTHFQVTYDSSRPDGQFRKDCSNALLKTVFPDFQFTTLFEGIKQTFKDFSTSSGFEMPNVLRRS